MISTLIPRRSKHKLVLTVFVVFAFFLVFIFLVFLVVFVVVLFRGPLASFCSLWSLLFLLSLWSFGTLWSWWSLWPFRLLWFFVFLWSLWSFCPLIALLCLLTLGSFWFLCSLSLCSMYGPLHVVCQVSFGFWVTWSISSRQEYYKSFFLPKSSDQLQNLFFCLLATKAQIFCKMNPLNSLRFISHQKNWDKCLLFVLNDEIDQNTKLPSSK